MSDIEKSNGGLPRTEAGTTFYRRSLGNPGPLGLFSFASTTLILSLYNVHARHILIPNIVVGMAIFCGGLTQFIAGMWEFATGNTFGATAFSSYGAFWLSFATIFIPGSGIATAYANDPAQESQAIAIYLLTWMIITFLFFIASLRKSIGLATLFFFLTLTFLLLAVSDFNGSVEVGKAGGYFGIITALIAYYCGQGELMTQDDLFTIPLGKFPPRRLD